MSRRSRISRDEKNSHSKPSRSDEADVAGTRTKTISKSLVRTDSTSIRMRHSMPTSRSTPLPNMRARLMKVVASTDAEAVVAGADKGATEEVTNVGEAATATLAEMIAEAASKIAGPEARAEILGNLETKKKITR